jgi:exodeoxyribonuclease VII large subunit
VRALQLVHPGRFVAVCRERVHGLGGRLVNAATRQSERRRDALHAAVRALQAMSPLATLTRGYAVLTESVTDGGRRAITSITNIRPGDSITAHVQDGAMGVRVETIDTDIGLPRLPALDDR